MAIELFISHHMNDSPQLKALSKMLSPLEKSGKAKIWHRDIATVGDEVEVTAARRLATAQVIVILLSSDYVASDTLNAEGIRALERQQAGEAQVLPIVVRTCYLEETPFASLKTLPNAWGAVTTAPDIDLAWAQIASQIGAAVWKRARSLAPQQESIPRYPDPTVKRLSEQLWDAQLRRERLLDAGADDAAAIQEILQIKRQLRDGGQLRAGDVLGDGRYLLLERIGRGGFADVWRAAGRAEGRDVAVKVLHANLAGDPLRRDRFFRGARVMARLGHPGVVRILEPHGVDGGWHYFVMELVSGGDLNRAVLTGQVPVRQVLSIVLAVGKALAAAHRNGIVHRDVKPANVLLDSRSAPRLTDFDLVAVGDTTGGTRTGAMGTFLYAAPEVLRRPQDADARADVFGLGMMAVFCWFGQELPPEVLRVPEEVLGALPCAELVREVLRRAISWKASERHRDATEFCAALQNAALCSMEAALRSDMEQGGLAVRAIEEALLKPRKLRGVTQVSVDRWKTTPTSEQCATVAIEWSMRWPKPPLLRTGDQQFVEVGEAFLGVTMDGMKDLSSVTVSSKSDYFENLVEWAELPSGVFLMGSPDDDAEADTNERPQHRVTIDSVLIGVEPITLAQFSSVTGRGFSNASALMPATGMSWYEAIEFCNLMSVLAGRSSCYVIQNDQVEWHVKANGFRLPTEAEWEYACRAGTVGRYSFGETARQISEFAWFSGNSDNRLHPSRAKKGNPWNLYDTHGNVWEMVWDVYESYELVTRRSGNDSDLVIRTPLDRPRVMRGGSFADSAWWLRTATRRWVVPGERSKNLGFRCVAPARRK